MTAAVMHWATPQGVYRRASSPDKTLRCQVKAKTGTNPAGENGLQKVEFYVSVNGGAATTTVATPKRCMPNYSETGTYRLDDPSFVGCEVVVDCAALAGGTIAVTARAYSNAGTQTNLGALKVYNDADGTDRRPGRRVPRYGNPVTGTAGGTGAINDPVDTIMRLLGVMRSNPAGSTQADEDCGGAEGFWDGPVVSPGGQGFGGVAWNTSDEWRAHIYSTGTDRTWRRIDMDPAVAVQDPDDYISGAGFGGAGSAHLALHGFDFLSNGAQIRTNGTQVVSIDDFDCTSHSPECAPNPTTSSVRYAERDGQATLFAINQGKRFSWGHERYGVATGFAGYTSIVDFKLHHVLGIALQPTSDEGPAPFVCAGEIYTLKYAPGEVDGYVDTLYNFVNVGGTHLTVSVQVGGPNTGKMRIDANDATPPDFAAQATVLVGTAYWGIKCSGFTTAMNNGTWVVLEVGTNGSGRPYIVLNNATPVPEVGASGSRMCTAKASNGSEYFQEVHVDVCQILNDLTDAGFAHVRVYDVHNFRAWVGSGRTLTRCYFDDLDDGSTLSGGQTSFSDFRGATLIDCYFTKCTWASPTNLWEPGGTFSGTEWQNNVFGACSDFPTSGVYVDGNHFIAGSTFSSANATTGAWFAGDPSSTPFSYLPSPGNLNTARAASAFPSTCWWPGATSDSRGVSKFVGSGDWTPPSGGGGGGGGGAGTSTRPRIGLGVWI